MIDIQASAGKSRFAIESVGVTQLAYPVKIRDKETGELQETVANWRMGVSLPSERRGTHMSRFIAELDERTHEAFDLDSHLDFAAQIAERLDAVDADLTTSFKWFRRVQAPVTGRNALIDVDVIFHSRYGATTEKAITLKVPTKALCPCSKAISERGAHNQRSLITVTLHYPANAEAITINRLVGLVERCASSPVYPLLKREDEKYVTEFAYDNPVFAEDIVRNVAEVLYDVAGTKLVEIEAVNQESIHAHDCFARLRFTRPSS